MMREHCFSIGHSIHEINTFIDMLKANGIDCIVDVRSSPYSRFAHQFNRESLQNVLKQSGIVYLFMGDMLGARYDDPSLLFPDGKVDFQKVSISDSFREGIGRVRTGIKKGYSIALMCSEKEPFDCHRFALVSKALRDEGVEVSHITPDEILTQDDLEERLFKKYKISRHDLFNSAEANRMSAYQMRNKDIAYNALTKEGDDE